MKAALLVIILGADPGSPAPSPKDQAAPRAAHEGPRQEEPGPRQNQPARRRDEPAPRRDEPAPRRDQHRAAAFTASSSLACAECHPRHYQEWVGSLHAHAYPAPFAGRAPVIPEAVPRGPGSPAAGSPTAGSTEQPDPACAGCHGPLDRLLGRSFPPDHPLDHGHPAERVVSCVTCHQVADEHARAGQRPCLPAGLERPSIETPFHRTPSMVRVRRAETCGPCHESSSRYGVPLERTFSQFLSSVHPSRGTTCVSCHMRPVVGPMAAGGPIRYSLHRHDAIGVDTAFSAVPEGGPQDERVLAFLRPALLCLLSAPERVEAGSEIEAVLSIKNTGAGHNFPAGLPGERRMWVEILAEVEGPEVAAGTEGGRMTLFRSGTPGRNGEPEGDPHLVELADRLVDASGQEVSSPDAAAAVDERSLRAMETRRLSYRISVPRSLAGSSLRLRARVLFRPAVAERLEARGIAALAPLYPVLELHREESGPIPIVEREFPPSVLRVPEDHPSISEALRRVPEGGTVLVGAGTYTLEEPLELTGRGVRLESRAGAARTVLVMGLSSREGARASVVVFRGRGAGGRADSLRGFTLRGGRGTREGEQGGPVVGGAILCRDARAALEDLIITKNQVEGDGAGLYAAASEVEIRGVRFERNHAAGRGGGLAFDAASRVQVIRSSFTGNSAARGGALAAAGGGLVLREVTARGNWAAEGGALALDLPAAPPAEAAPGGRAGAERRFEIEVLEASGNLARSGAGILLEGPGEVRLLRPLIAGNRAYERGGGVLLRRGARAVLEHATVVENSARVGGGVAGDRATGASARVESSIVWGNRPPLLTGQAERSVVDDTRHRGGSNPDLLPLFESGEGEWLGCGDLLAADCVPLGETSPAEGAVTWRRFVPGDYRLIHGSPTVDAGDPRARPDPDGTIPDLGALHRPQAGRSFIRGDLDGDGRPTLADLALAAARLAGGDPLPCDDAADLDDSGRLDVDDLLWLRMLETGLGPPPPPPFPACGLDPVLDDGLGCFETAPRCR